MPKGCGGAARTKVRRAALSLWAQRFGAYLRDPSGNKVHIVHRG
jgi:hypothetical protein